MILKSKRAQASAGMLLLVFVAIILVIIALVFVFVEQKEDIFGKSRVYEEKEKISEKNNVNYEKNYQKINEIICPSPYIKVGNICCLDSNYNAICDKDEEVEKKQVPETCYPPYLRIGSSCCLDDNENRICDINERYSEENRRIRSIDIDSPFDLNSVEVYTDELSFDLQNEGSEDVIIKKIRIDDCNSETSDKTIEKGKEKSFSLDCDFGYGRFDSDIEIEYMKVGGNETLSADGTVSGEILRYSDYMNEYN